MESKIPVNNPMPFPKRERILISVNEAAQMLNLSKSYIYRETRNRTILRVYPVTFSTPIGNFGDPRDRQAC